MTLADSIRIVDDIAETGDLAYTEAQYTAYLDLRHDKYPRQQLLAYFGPRALESMERLYKTEHCERCDAWMEDNERDRCDEKWGAWICDACEAEAKRWNT